MSTSETWQQEAISASILMVYSTPKILKVILMHVMQGYMGYSGPFYVSSYC